jgi:hypothetical protein
MNEVHERALTSFAALANRRVMSNTIRALYVEHQVAALLPEWEHVGDWDGWDFERNGVRLEVKASAARQAWQTDKPVGARYSVVGC